ncbi:MAG: energy-coupling factor transporter ATPase, partial [Clostridia bacterium]|nr:energy-coupling factor transporter ATPase [Clostridia bacterium]
QVAAINNINLCVEKGETLGIIGHTGSGKSTLIAHFNGLLKPDEGEVLVDGKNIFESKETLRQSRFKVGLCFQYPEYQLFEETVYKDIAFGPKNMKLPQEEIDRRVLTAAGMAGVRKENLEKSPFDLSGGEKRRAAIAGVMSMEPQVLVLDEPAAGLDPAGRRELINMIKNYRRATGCTVIIVSHSMEDIASVADRVCVLNKAEIAMLGTPKEVYTRDEELRSMGLNVPEITRIFIMLKKRGLDVPADVFTVDDAVASIRKLSERGKA